jgi:large subunit ribosomal protein L6e
VTGPFQLNGIPLRRINPAYVIATSTRVDISSVNLEKFCDSYFAAPRKIKKEKSEGAIIFFLI